MKKLFIITLMSFSLSAMDNNNNNKIVISPTTTQCHCTPKPVHDLSHQYRSLHLKYNYKFIINNNSETDLDLHLYAHTSQVMYKKETIAKGTKKEFPWTRDVDNGVSKFIICLGSKEEFDASKSFYNNSEVLCGNSTCKVITEANDQYISLSYTLPLSVLLWQYRDDLTVSLSTLKALHQQIILDHSINKNATALTTAAALSQLTNDSDDMKD